MPKIPYLIKRRETWYIRLRIPVELVAAYKGRKEIQRSLQTRDYKEALKRLSPMKSEIEAEFTRMRKQLKAQTDNTDVLSEYSDHDLIQLTRKWFSDIRNAEEKQRINDTGQWSAENIREYTTELQQEEWHSRQEMLGISQEEEHTGMTIAARLLRTEGISYRNNSENFRKLGHFFSKAIHELTVKSLREHQGKLHIPDDTLFSNTVSHTAPVKEPRRMDDLLKEFLSDPTLRRSESTIKNYRVIKRAIDEVIGGQTFAHEVTREQCREISRLLIAFPSNATKRTNAKTMAETVRLAEENEWDRVSDSTYNMYMQKLNALMEYAVQESAANSNPAKKLYVRSEMKAKDRRHPFKLEQLQSIFGNEQYLGWRDTALLYKKKCKDKAAYGYFWIPLIALWMGMRLNEICQLYESDVTMIDNVHVIIIQETGADDEETEKRVKSTSGTRRLPIHPMLIEAGFLSYVESIRKAGEQRVFPHLILDARGYYSHEFSKWFTRYLKNINAKVARTSFHSFRHTYRDAIRKAKLSRDAGLQLGGWSSGATDDAYGEGLSVRDLSEEVYKIKYEGLDLSHLYK